MNWYKLSQNIYQQYGNLQQQLGAVKVIGPGQSAVLNIGGQSIAARQILDKAISAIRSVLVQNGIHTIDTAMLPPDKQGLAISHEPGKVHVDVQKIFNNFQQSLPSTIQTDGAAVDQDLVNILSKEILREIGGTIAHESAHMRDYWNAAKNNQPFTSVQEAPGPAFEQQIKNRYF